MLLTTHVKELVKNIKSQPKTQPQTNILPTPQPQNSPRPTQQPQATTNPIINRNEENIDFQGYQLFAKLPCQISDFVNDKVAFTNCKFYKQNFHLWLYNVESW